MVQSVRVSLNIRKHVKFLHSSIIQLHELTQEWQEKHAQRGNSHSFVWNKQQFDAVDAQTTDYLLGKSHVTVDTQTTDYLLGDSLVYWYTSWCICNAQDNCVFAL